MKKTRHTEEQIAFALKQAETGTSVAEVINGRLRDECLNTHWFLSLENARAKI